MAGSGTGTPITTASTTWSLSQIRSTARDLIGEHLTGNLTDSDLDRIINEYYQNDFAQELGLRRFDQKWTQQAVVTDAGEYTVSEDVIEIEQPVFANDDELLVYLDRRAFWQVYPSQEEYTTPPTLAVGTSDAAAVAHSAFRYTLDSYGRAKAAAETALSGDTVPQNTYGAWFLEIDADGDITVQAAADNGTGYATPALAVDGLPAKSANCIVMGFVTIINTSGTFVPGTTELSASGVTATVTDGDPKLRGVPEAVLLDRSEAKAYLRPKANDDYYLKSMASLQRPAAMASDSGTPHDEAWGRALSIGAAIKYLTNLPGDTSYIAELMHGGTPEYPTPGSLRYELNRIARKQSLQLAGRGVQRAW